ncbi:MAG: type VI secretion system baseplate subunit TssE [Inhella sp.]|jgi:type VI secretion system protein ImpF
MAGPGASQDRLQPSLLDRLTDLEPGKLSETLEARVLNRKQLREAVLRDIAWLLNAVCEEPGLMNLRANPDRITLWQQMAHARDSVMNFGVPPLTGQSITMEHFPVIEEQLRLALIRFEPRIDPETLEVRVLNDMSTGARPTSIRISLKGQMWNQPVPLELLLSAEVDVDTGQTSVRDLRS